MSLLAVDNLSVQINGTPVLRGVNLTIGAGETVALVGESGSGKSLTALSIMRLLPAGASATGLITLGGADILSADEAQMDALRGKTVGMVFQEPMTALNPVQTIRSQVAEGIRLHMRVSSREASMQADAMLDRVGLPASTIGSRYPHELSGGQRQRVVIAIACACNPRLLIADEPTTALDVVLQKQILDLLRSLVEERRMSLLLISHDLAVVADMADRIAVMRDGAVVEAGDVVDVLRAPSHAYTRQLAKASAPLPARPEQRAPLPGSPLLEIRNLVHDYRGRRESLFRLAKPFRAVDDVSLTLSQARSVALMGRSGCGKSTLARAALALLRPTSGAILFEGKPLDFDDEQALRPVRRNMQVVFQDPYGSFDPRQRVEKLLAEPLHLLDERPSKSRSREMVAAALEEVGLPADAMRRLPHEFSGGQRQRLAIARAIILRPKLIIADEPVSALDVSVRARILELFADLNKRWGLASLFITHDLHVARAIADEVLVMHEGRIVERGTPSEVLGNPKTGPARALVAATPDLAAAIDRRMARRQDVG